MPFEILLTNRARCDLVKLEQNPSLVKLLKAVRKAIGYLQTNTKHPSLNTHKYGRINGQNKEDVFEAYAENHTPTAYRIFWHYGPGKYYYHNCCYTSPIALSNQSNLSPPVIGSRPANALFSFIVIKSLAAIFAHTFSRFSLKAEIESRSKSR